MHEFRTRDRLSASRCPLLPSNVARRPLTRHETCDRTCTTVYHPSVLDAGPFEVDHERAGGEGKPTTRSLPVGIRALPPPLRQMHSIVVALGNAHSWIHGCKGRRLWPPPLADATSSRASEGTMNSHNWRALLPLVVLGAILGACGDSNPTKPVNRSPLILSASVFPAAIGAMDSAIVVCQAIDPDADSLFYDWRSDSRLRFRGAPPGDRFLSNTYENYVVVYPDYIASPVDTPWVQCGVRDRRGGGDVTVVRLVVRQ